MSITRSKIKIRDASFFQNKQTQNAQKLLDLVIIADHAKAIALASQDPTLILAKSTFINSQGTTKEVSPLEFAFTNSDVYLCSQFFDIVKTNPVLLTQFQDQLRHAATHHETDSLFEVLHAAYNNYTQAVDTWCNKIAFNKLKELGLAQKNLPMWALKKMCKEQSTAWDWDTKFKLEIAQASCSATIAEPPYHRLDVIADKDSLGANYFLMRATGYSSAEAKPLNGDLYVVRRDALMFKMLSEETALQRQAFLLDAIRYETAHTLQTAPSN